VKGSMQKCKSGSNHFRSSAAVSPTEVNNLRHGIYKLERGQAEVT
jgi:hypothetical protein